MQWVEKKHKLNKMAQFVTHIQPTLMEASQGHIPHHHQSGTHTSFLPHSGHNLPSPPTQHHHGVTHSHTHAHGHSHGGSHSTQHTSKEHSNGHQQLHHQPQHYEDFALIVSF